jgi:hypothetical protein
MSQAERDEYHRRATPHSTNLWFPTSAFAASEDQGGRWGKDSTRLKSEMVNLIGVAHPMTPCNQALWTKMQILLYHLDDRDDGAVFESVAIAVPNSQGGTAARRDREFSNVALRRERGFSSMAMTRTGTVVIQASIGPWVLVTQEAPDTGKLLLCEFEHNGQLSANDRLRPWFMYEFWPLLVALGKSVQEVLDTRNKWRFGSFNQP